MPPSARKPPTPNHQCQYCPMAFKKLEHAQRHERTHTHERPYACSCGKTFARQDTLNRHARLHNRTEEEIAAKARRRRVKSMSNSSITGPTSETPSTSTPSTNPAPLLPTNLPPSSATSNSPAAIFISHELPSRRYSDVSLGRRPNLIWPSAHLTRSMESSIIPLPSVDEPFDTQSLTPPPPKKRATIDIFYEDPVAEYHHSPTAQHHDLANYHPTPVDYIHQSPFSPSHPIFLPPPVPQLPQFISGPHIPHSEAMEFPQVNPLHFASLTLSANHWANVPDVSDDFSASSAESPISNSSFSDGGSSNSSISFNQSVSETPYGQLTPETIVQDGQNVLNLLGRQENYPEPPRYNPHESIWEHHSLHPSIHAMQMPVMGHNYQHAFPSLDLITPHGALQLDLYAGNGCEGSEAEERRQMEFMPVINEERQKEVEASEC